MITASKYKLFVSLFVCIHFLKQGVTLLISFHISILHQHSLHLWNILEIKYINK